MSNVLVFSTALARIVAFIGRSAAWLALPLSAVIVFDVVTRKYNLIQGTPLEGFVSSTKLQELEWHLHAALFLLALAWAYLADAHVRIDIVRERMSARTRAWVELLGCLAFLIPYAIVVLAYSSQYVWSSFLIDEGSAAKTGLPHRWIIKSALPLAFLLIACAGISTVLNRAVYLMGGHWEREDADRRRDMIMRE